jgi:broad specificity phosphatase PhoE
MVVSLNFKYMNKLNLKHRYFTARHGQSHNNVARIVVGDTINGIKSEYGLTEIGHKQAELAGQLFALQHPKSKVVIYCSPFARTVETAEGINKGLAFPVESLIIDERLKETGFGSLELEPYEVACPKQDLVFAREVENTWGIETPDLILKRLVSLIEEIEASDLPEDTLVFLVTHGGCVEILNGYFINLPDIFLFQIHTPDARNAEIRALN